MAARIIIADGLATNRIALKTVLGTARHAALPAASADDVRALLREAPAALLLLDLDLPGDALALLRDLRSPAGAPEMPIIATLDRNDPARRLAALSGGADDIVLKPIATPPLLARVRSLLRTADTRAALTSRADTVRDLGFAEQNADFALPGRIALVSGVPGRAQELLGAVHPLSMHRLEAVTPDSALDLAEGSAAPDVFVIHASAAQPQLALRLVADLRALPSARHSGILVVHNRDDPDTAAMALDLGASSLVEAGVPAPELALLLDIQVRRKQEGDRLRADVEERLRLAVEDPLTGLFNRRYAMAHLRRLSQGPGIEQACVILADIDRFKSVNDRYGHAVGDAVLTEVAHRLRANLRAPDMVARIGGEEFLIVMRDTNPEAALQAAERLCELVRARPVPAGDAGMTVPVTISLGLAMARGEEPIEKAVERADRALYEAKSDGRDKVTVSPDSCAA